MQAAVTNDTHLRFEHFVEQHRDRAVRLAWRLLGDEQAALDVAQDAFAKAARSLDRLRDPDRLASWFYKTLVRRAHNHRRWARLRGRFWAPFRETPSLRPTGDPGLRSRISSAMDELTDAQRQAFVLVHLEQFTVREVAEITGRAPGTVKSHLHRALVHLRHALADLDPREDR